MNLRVTEQSEAPLADTGGTSQPAALSCGGAEQAGSLDFQRNCAPGVSPPYRVLVFPGGTEIGLEIQRALCLCKDIQLYSAGLDIANHAPYVFRNHHYVPGVFDPEWIPALNRILRKERIDYIFPAHDDVITALAEADASIDAASLISPLETCLISRSKRRTYRALAGTVPVPEVYEHPDSIRHYPVFAKPDRGEASRDVHLIRSSAEAGALRQCPRRDYVFMEYLPGDEYTIECLTDREEGLLFCGGRQRIRTKDGISMTSRPAGDAAFVEYAQAISARLKFSGAWFFQLKRDKYGVLKLLEVAPRIAGTAALLRVLGVNLPLLTLYEHQRRPLTVLLNRMDVEIDRALLNRYRHQVAYSAVYIDLDDTLILNGAVNLAVVRLMYQCINKGIRIVLLTKHEGDANAVLRQHRLQGIFDEVIQVERRARKSDYILEQDAILIDDSFSERKEAVDRRGLLTFDCSMVEMLFDDRA